jgi:hypothetical protein
VDERLATGLRAANQSVSERHERQVNQSSDLATEDNPMIVFALIVLAAIVGGYVYFARKVRTSQPDVPPVSVPGPVKSAPLADLAGSADVKIEQK